jgi:two-component system sensor histidine kinase HydH
MVLALCLLGSTVLAYGEAKALAPTLARGQAETYLRAFREYTRPEYGPPSKAVLEQLLDEHSSGGLRALTLLDPPHGVELAVGHPALSDRAEGLAPGQLHFESGRVLMVAPPPPLPPPPGAPPPPPDGTTAAPPRHPPAPHLGRGPGPPPLSPHPGQARLILEFEPLAAERLTTRAQVTLLFGIVASVLLVAAATVLWRLLLRGDRGRRLLEEQRQLARLGEMSSVLAHEIRNPLAAVKGHAQLLAEQTVADSRARERVDIVVEEVLRLERLTTDLLAFARSGTIDRQDAAPARILERAAERVDGGRIEIDVDEAPERWPLDGARMEQVLENLLRNAVQASAAGELITAAVTSNDDELIFAIRDRGPGIAPADRGRIFQPFHTTRTRGTGLGLAVAHRIVEQHGGRIEVTSPTGGGALFQVFVPQR